MTGRAKAKGDRAERELAELLTVETGYEVRRALGAGRLDDQGDMEGLKFTVVQCANYADTSRACLQKPRDAEMQRWNAKEKFAVSMVRWRGGHWRAVMTIQQFWKILKAAIWAVENGYKG